MDHRVPRRSASNRPASATELVLAAGVGPDNNNYDHSEWVDAQLTCAAAR